MLVAHFAQHPQHRIGLHRPDLGRLVGGSDGGNQPLGVVIGTNNLGIHFAGRPMDQPRPDRVDIAGVGNIEPTDIAVIFSESFRQIPHAGNRKVAGKMQYHRSVFARLFDKIASYCHHVYR